MKNLVNAFYVISLCFFISFMLENFNISEVMKDSITALIVISILAVYQKRKKKRV